MAGRRSVAALVATALAVAAVAITAARPHERAAAPPPASTSRASATRASTATVSPGRPLGPRPSAIPPSPAGGSERGGREVDENRNRDSPPTARELAVATRGARHFAAAWLAHAVGRGPLSGLADALLRLRERLDVVRGRLPTTGPRPPVPHARLIGLRRQRPGNPRLLIARLAITGSRDLSAADLLLVWLKQRWRVADLAPH
jgi:hypothetical protein